MHHDLSTKLATASASHSDNEVTKVIYTLLNAPTLASVGKYLALLPLDRTTEGLNDLLNTPRK